MTKKKWLALQIFVILPLLFLMASLASTPWQALTVLVLFIINCVIWPLKKNNSTELK